MTDGIVSGFLPTTLAPTHTLTQVDRDSDPRPAERTEPADDRPGEFGRLVEIVRENDRLLAELELLRARLAEARSYQSGPRPNPTLAQAYIARERTKRSNVLARLRANRIEIDRILGGGRREATAR